MMIFNKAMNDQLAANYAKVKPSLLLIPLFVTAAVIGFLLGQGVSDVTSYVYVQQEVFHFLNAYLSQFACLEYNLTQLGDAFVSLALLSVFLVTTPKIWQALLPASLVSLLFSKSLKSLFDVPRPATIFGADNIHIIGETLVGYSSFPSGHSITAFTTLTVLMFAFVPSSKKRFFRAGYFLCWVLLGLMVATTRIGVGAHHPIDVLMGSVLGYTAGILGIYCCKKISLFSWVSNRKSYPFFMLLFLGSIVFLIKKMVQEPLFIYYLPLASLIVSLFVMIKSYVKQNQ